MGDGALFFLIALSPVVGFIAGVLIMVLWVARHNGDGDG